MAGWQGHCGNIVFRRMTLRKTDPYLFFISLFLTCVPAVFVSLFFLFIGMGDGFVRAAPSTGVFGPCLGACMNCTEVISQTIFMAVFMDLSQLLVLL